MPSRLKIAVVSFEISAILSAICGLLWIAINARMSPSIVLPERSAIPWNLFELGAVSIGLIGFLFLFAVAPFFHFVAVELRLRKYWAWFAGLLLSGVMILSVFKGMSLFAVLGALALWGLLDKDTLAVFLPRNSDNNN